MKLIGLEEYVAQYQAARQRLGEWGIRVDNVTRIGQYETMLRKMARAEAAGDESHQGKPEALSLFLETYDLQAISDLPSELILEHPERRRVRMIAGGLPIVSGFTEHDPARDVAFELSMAAYLNRHGSLSGFSRHGGDLVVGKNSHPMECKRVTSMNSLEHRLRDGRRKLIDLRQKGQLPGVIAVDLSTPVYENWSAIEGQDDDDIYLHTDARLTSQLLSFFREHKAIISELVDEAVLGIIARYISVGTSDGAGSVRVTPAFHMISIHPDGSDLDAAFSTLNSELFPIPAVIGTIDDLERAFSLYPTWQVDDGRGGHGVVLDGG